jgi:DNA-directed RNA polymerase specialized sigma24 family protein
VPALIAPLRKKKGTDGTLYFRPPPIEESLKSLYEAPIEEVARRARIDDPEDPDYVPSECVVHFVRQSKCFGDTEPFRELFVILRNRVLRTVPVFLRNVAGLSEPGTKSSESEIQELVLHDFLQLLCTDRNEYDERLDFYEIRFNSAIAKLRMSARRKVVPYESRRQSLDDEGDVSTQSNEVEETLSRLREPPGENENNIFYRSRVYAAINTLRPKERQVIELILKGVPIDSNDEKILTIVKVLGCAEKTVRNRRDRAIATIQKALKEEELT